MLEPTRIHVTNADIANGEPGNEEQCPIALALRRAYPERNFLVGPECILLLAGGIATDKYLLPPRLINWIGAYDSKYDVKPITFTFPSFEE